MDILIEKQKKPGQGKEGEKIFPVPSKKGKTGGTKARGTQ